MTAYYNELDPYAAQWLRNLIDGGHIARGDVDERSIVDVRADDLRGYTQAHFFAGIGGWSIALRLAGWPDTRPVWTGSCPCQPFSAAGAGKAADDERHLWPAWLPLIAECRPAIVFGEQVEAAIGWGWLDAVFADLEAEGYACGAAVLPACGVGAPHIRNRLWFVADSGGERWQRREGSAQGSEPHRTDAGRQQGHDGPVRLHETGGAVADADGGDASAARVQRGWEQRQQPQDGRARELGVANSSREHRGSGKESGQASEGEAQVEGQNGQRLRAIAIGASSIGSLGHANGAGLSERERDGRVQRQALGPHTRQAAERRGDVGGFWSDAEWIACTDGKSRPVGPGSFPLGHGIRNRPSKLRAYGNAIVPQIAAEFIRASVE